MEKTTFLGVEKYFTSFIERRNAFFYGVIHDGKAAVHRMAHGVHAFVHGVA